MTVSQAQVSSFKQIYKEIYGRVLSDDEAYEMASNLLSLYFTVYVKTTVENEDDKP